MGQRIHDRRRSTARRGRRRGQRLLVLGVVLVALMASVAGLAHSQRDARDSLQARYTARSALAAAFAQTYVGQLLNQERAVATRQLSAGASAFPTIVESFGFSNAVLLDARGRVMRIYPEKPTMLGTALAGKYPHLTTAETGRPAVSPVVAAAADGQPVVAFAVPFDTSTGRRVFSGGYAVRSTPLAAYLKTMVPLSGSRVYLVDVKGTLLASAPDAALHGTLVEHEPDLASVYRSGPSGSAAGQFWTATAVPGTPWTVVTAIPRSSLLAPVSGSSRYLPWLILAGLLGTVLLAWSLLFRRFEDHDELRLAYRRLDLMASLDGLTEIANRRAGEQQLVSAQEQAWRAGESLTVLMVDVDHFKRINDTFGHLAGDQALIEVSRRLQGVLRADDSVVRWGGEEFLVILPLTRAREAALVAERLRQAVAAEPVALGTDGDPIIVTVSIGAATSNQPAVEVLVHAADRALYEAKNNGRDQVCLVSS